MTVLAVGHTGYCGCGMVEGTLWPLFVHDLPLGHVKERETFIIVPEVLARASLSADRQSPGGWVGSAHSLPGLMTASQVLGKMNLSKNGVGFEN